MKTTVVYFNSESKVREYAEKNGCKYIDNYLTDRREKRYSPPSVLQPLRWY